jgi:hypothetical protein
MKGVVRVGGPLTRRIMMVGAGLRSGSAKLEAKTEIRSDAIESQMRYMISLLEKAGLQLTDADDNLRFDLKIDRKTREYFVYHSLCLLARAWDILASESSSRAEKSTALDLALQAGWLNKEASLLKWDAYLEKDLDRLQRAGHGLKSAAKAKQSAAAVRNKPLIDFATAKWMAKPDLPASEVARFAVIQRATQLSARSARRVIAELDPKKVGHNI